MRIVIFVQAIDSVEMIPPLLTFLMPLHVARIDRYDGEQWHHSLPAFTREVVVDNGDSRDTSPDFLDATKNFLAQLRFFLPHSAFDVARPLQINISISRTTWLRTRSMVYT